MYLFKRLGAKAGASLSHLEFRRLRERPLFRNQHLVAQHHFLSIASICGFLVLLF